MSNCPFCHKSNIIVSPSLSYSWKRICDCKGCGSTIFYDLEDGFGHPLPEPVMFGYMIQIEYHGTKYVAIWYTNPPQFFVRNTNINFMFIPPGITPLTFKDKLPTLLTFQ